jgi:hypothetical protein
MKTNGKMAAEIDKYLTSAVNEGQGLDSVVVEALCYKPKGRG